jgi:hypothetical protein
MTHDSNSLYIKDHYGDLINKNNVLNQGFHTVNKPYLFLVPTTVENLEPRKGV